MILYIMATGVYPIQVRSVDDITRIYTNMKHIPLEFGDIQNYHLKRLIGKLLQIQTVDRINARDLKEHMQMFGKIFYVQQEKCREDLFELKKFKVTKEQKVNTIRRVRSAKVNVVAKLEHRQDSINEHVFNEDANIAFKA